MLWDGNKKMKKKSEMCISSFQTEIILHCNRRVYAIPIQSNLVKANFGLVLLLFSQSRKMRKEDPLISEICSLHQANNVKGLLSKISEIVKSSNKEALSLLRLLTWPSPRESDLTQFSEFIASCGITHIYSIGCGTGLLEWLIMKWLENSSNGNGIDVTGVEIDFGWWTSAYSPPMFLPLVFVDKDFKSSEPFGKATDLALFCYFNNLKVFLDYLAVFRGKYVAILGPMGNTQFCEPAPLELRDNPKMPRDQWKMLFIKPFGFGNVDYLAVYEKV